jgi:hypothetical protein
MDIQISTRLRPPRPDYHQFTNTTQNGSVAHTRSTAATKSNQWNRRYKKNSKSEHLRITTELPETDRIDEQKVTASESKESEAH